VTVAREVRINEADPFNSALFLIRSEIARSAPPFERMKGIQMIMMAFNDTMKELQEKEIIPLTQWPTGTEE
jgi:hypothetical protein